MNVTVINKSLWSDEAIKAITDFLAPCYGDVKMPVVVKFYYCRGAWGAWGKAYHPRRYDRRGVKKGAVLVRVWIGIPMKAYPYTWTYKKTAGSFTANSHVEQVVDILAHELRHVEQYEAARLAALDQPALGALKNYNFTAWFRRFKKANYERGSAEVDAERVGHGLLAAYRTYVENNVRRVA